MERLIARILDNPFMVTMLVVLFIISMALFYRRVRREMHHSYRPPPLPFRDEH